MMPGLDGMLALFPLAPPSLATIVVGGAAGSGLILTSTDGLTWSSKNPNVANTLRAIAYNGTMWVAVGAGGVITTSTNGTTWTARTAPFAKQLNAVIWANNQWVACGMSGAVITSPDGITWTSRTAGGTSYNFYSMSYGAGLYVICAYYNLSGVAIFTSTDGITWTNRTVPSNSTSQYPYAMGWNGSYFLVTGWTVSAYPFVYTSTDGINWTKQNNITVMSGTSIAIQSIIWKSGAWYAVGASGGNVVVSTNATSWIRYTAISTHGYNTIVYNGSYYVAAGGTAIDTSANGTTGWTARTSGTTLSILGGWGSG